ncbi:hypothetical protein FRB94_008258 [Tulasnella sp. JGI-2019a]|nr:hypothetical protein FRB94_008258 [Tulasnella sp. JGI-2019a]KAG9010604.1 hypothetical protein FRB93_003872 [Tulasnella sp. JGI-2019a]KAG9030884.1 hypothetical protein FRB95_003447 [Tulasnella sp. JGI-2019a]
MLLQALSLAGFASGAFAALATTTNYYDGTLGACGCGTVFNSYIYTAAGSQALFGSGTWCGSGCGNCYVLTSTGTSPPGEGTGSAVGSSIMVAITNLCPYAGNENWCPNVGSTNAYGYGAHFDINTASGNGGWSSLGWNNPIVDYEPIACPSPLPTLYANAATCECAVTSVGSATSNTSTTSKVTTTSTTTKATSTSTASGATQTHYGQCGGTGYT